MPSSHRHYADWTPSPRVCALHAVQAGNSNPFGRCLRGKTIRAGRCSTVVAGSLPPQKQQSGCRLIKSFAFIVRSLSKADAWNHYTRFPTSIREHGVGLWRADVCGPEATALSPLSRVLMRTFERPTS